MKKTIAKVSLGSLVVSMATLDSGSDIFSIAAVVWMISTIWLPIEVLLEKSDVK